MWSFHGGPGRPVVVLLAMLVATPALVTAVSPSDLKAAFIYNFARFTLWPGEVVPANSPIVLCVAGDPDVAQSLDRAVQGKAVGGHALLVRRVGADQAVRGCQLLYAGDLNDTRARQLVSLLKDAPVLAISDLEAFTGIGGTAHFFMEGDRMRFAVNVDAANRANVRISAQLLNLARIVKESHAAAP